MKIFMKELLKQIAYTFTIMMIVFLSIGFVRGVETISIYRIIQLLEIAINSI